MCGHQGYVDADYLRKKTVEKKQKTKSPLVARSLPRITAEEVFASASGQWRWLKDLNEYGVCLMTGLPAKRGELLKLGELFYGLQTTIYNKANCSQHSTANNQLFDIVVEPDPINIAYSTSGLLLHQDLPYYESPMGLQFLHCLRNDKCVRGGESILLDAYVVLEELREKHPQHFAALSRIPATFENTHLERARPFSMRCQRPHIALDGDGNVIGFNWSPPVEGALDVPEDDVIPYFEAYSCLGRMIEESPYTISHRLEPGEVMTLNNRRMLHGRTEIELNGGTRLLEGCYINIDEFKGKFEALCTLLGRTEYTTTRVFNNFSF